MNELATLKVAEEDGVLVAHIAGEIDLSNVGDLQAALEPACADKSLVVDLTNVTYLDSAGIRLLFALANACRDQGYGLRAVVPENVPIRRVLDVSDVDSVVPVDVTLAAAITALGHAS